MQAERIVTIYNNPLDVIDPNQGINVNRDTLDEIHRRGIIDEDQLAAQKEDIRRTIERRKKDD